MSADIDSLISIGKQSMESAVADGEELLPNMLVTADGQLIVVALAVDGNPVDVIPTVVAAFKNIESIAFTSDTYHTKDMSVPRPLQIPFEAGDPRVSEALAITIVTNDSKEDTLVLLPYKRTVDGLEWDEQVVHTGKGLGGRVTEFLRRAIVTSGKR